MAAEVSGGTVGRAGGPEVLEVAPRRTDPRVLRVVLAGLLVVALAVGGIAAVDRFRGGASSPTVLADRVVTAVDQEDLAGLARLVEPAERTALLRTGSALGHRLADLGLPESVGGGATVRPADALRGLDLTLTGADPRVESRDGDVAVVGLGNLRVQVRTDPDAAHGLLRLWFAEHRSTTPEQTTYAVDDLPPLGLPARLVVVERGGRWYLSVLATLLGPGVRAGGIPAVETGRPASSPDPRAAVESTLHALLDAAGRGDVTALARTLDPSGADLAQLWGPQLVRELRRPSAGISALTTSAGPAEDDRAVVRLDALRVGDGAAFDLAGPCVATGDKRSCLRPTPYRYAGGAGTLGALELIGHDGAFTLTAVHGADGWRTSLPESLADALVGYADGLTREQVLMVLNSERLDAPTAVLRPDEPQEVRFTSGGYALLTVPVARAGLLRVEASPGGTNRASLYAPDGQPALQPFFPNDSVYRLEPGDHTLLVWADDPFSATLRTGEPYVQRVAVRSIG